MNLHNVILPPRERGRVATLREIESAMLQGAQAIFPVVGECLEGAGVQDGGWVAVDFTKYPAPPGTKARTGTNRKTFVSAMLPFRGPRALGSCARLTAACGDIGRW